MKSVATIIVTYNRLSFLKDLIESLRCQTYTQQKIIVVNNSSTDGTLEWLQTQTDLFVITQENCGGAGGFYTGLKYATENNFDYAWIMDDDVLCKKDSLENLVDKTESCDGFLCSKVIDEQGKPCNVPGLWTKKQANGEQEWTEKIEKNMVRLSITSFVSVLIPTAVIKNIGLPYREFYIWGDDTEYTRRISEKYDSYLCGTSVVVHRRKINTILSIFREKDKKRVKNYFYFYRNGLFYAKKYSSWYQIIYRYFRCLFDMCKALFTVKPRAFLIILKAFFSSFFFSPKVSFVCKV